MIGGPKTRATAIAKAMDRRFNPRWRALEPAHPPPTPDDEWADWTALYIALIAACLIGALIAFVFDRQMADFFHRFDQSTAVRFARFLTVFGLAGWYLVISWFFSTAFRANPKWRRWKHRPLYIFLAVAVSGLVADLLKVVVGRSRPDLLFARGQYDHVFWRFGHDLNSFPSGHATTMGAAAIGLSLLFPRYRLFFLIFGMAIAATRFITAVHFLSDALTGFALGALCAFILHKGLLLRGWRL